MVKLFTIFLCVLFCASSASAADKIEITFQTLEELGTREKPVNRIDNAKEALDFILADKIVRQSITTSIAKGYTKWKATAEKAEDADVFAVTLNSKNLLPPYTCYFRFDAIGNDLRERPWSGCQYE